jgi:hypothetical protein
MQSTVAPASTPTGLRRRPRRARAALALAAGSAVVAALLSVVPSPVAAAAVAPGAPGAMSHFDLARKDCLGTARNSSSKVWFTVAGGVLSDVYYPTVDNTNVETLQLVVTDGATFTDLQTRDTTYTVSALDPSGMSCRVTSTARNGRYTLVTDYVTDPARNSVVMHTTLNPAKGPSDLKVYVRFDATVNGNGGGGDAATANAGADDAVIDTTTGSPVPVSLDTETSTIAANRDYATPVYAALRGKRATAWPSSTPPTASPRPTTRRPTATWSRRHRSTSPTAVLSPSHWAWAARRPRLSVRPAPAHVARSWTRRPDTRTAGRAMTSS